MAFLYPIIMEFNDISIKIESPEDSPGYVFTLMSQYTMANGNLLHFLDFTDAEILPIWQTPFRKFDIKANVALNLPRETPTSENLVVGFAIAGTDKLYT